MPPPATWRSWAPGPVGLLLAENSPRAAPAWWCSNEKNHPHGCRRRTASSAARRSNSPNAVSWPAPAHVVSPPRFPFGPMTLRLGIGPGNPLHILPMPQARLEELLGSARPPPGRTSDRGHEVAGFTEQDDLGCGRRAPRPGDGPGDALGISSGAMGPAVRPQAHRHRLPRVHQSMRSRGSRGSRCLPTDRPHRRMRSTSPGSATWRRCVRISCRAAASPSHRSRCSTPLRRSISISSARMRRVAMTSRAIGLDRRAARQPPPGARHRSRHHRGR